jgi:hypothetical protein
MYEKDEHLNDPGPVMTCDFAKPWMLAEGGPLG